MRKALAQDGVAGFTMLEALVSLALMAFLVGALATMAAQWLPSWDRGFVRMQRMELLSAGVGRLVDDFAAAEFVSSGGANDLLIFDGAESQATFVRTAIGPNTHSGLQIVHIGPAASERGAALTRTTAPFAIDPAGLAVGRFAFGSPVAFLRAPYRAHFAYQGEDRQWRSEWRGQTRLPRAVRVAVSDASGAMVLQAAALVGAQYPARCATSKSVADCEGLITGNTAAQPGTNPAPIQAPNH